MKYTRFLAALLAAIMLLSLAACGKTPAATGTTTPAATTPAATTPAATTPAATTPAQADEEPVFFDQTTGIIIHKWTDAFLPYQEYMNVMTNVLDPGKGEYVFTLLLCMVPNPENLDEPFVASPGMVISSTAPDATTETVLAVLQTVSPEVTELETFTNAFGQTMWLMRNSASTLDYLPEEQKLAFSAMMDDVDEQVAQIEAVKPKLETAAGQVVFTTVDLDGNPVDSSVFANAEYTMINVWGSFCGPCIREMGDLMKMDAEMDNIQIITILGDATSPDDDTAEDAREIVDALNLTLPVYLVNEEIMALLPFNAFPTSFLVDREGNPLGAACVGAVGTEKYQDWIRSCIGG